MNAHHIRLAALDMDGTLLREDKTLSAYTLRVLGCLADRGVILVPATGRVREGLTENILTLPSISYAICANGAYIEDIKKNQVLASWAAGAETGGTDFRLSEKFSGLLLHPHRSGYLSSKLPGSGMAESTLSFFELSEGFLLRFRAAFKRTGGPAAENRHPYSG